MKQQISPVVIGVSAVVMLCVIIFIATRVMRGPAQSDAAVAPPPAATINGHQVPAGAPTAAFQKAREEAGQK